MPSKAENPHIHFGVNIVFFVLPMIGSIVWAVQFWSQTNWSFPYTFEQQFALLFIGFVWAILAVETGGRIHEHGFKSASPILTGILTVIGIGFFVYIVIGYEFTSGVVNDYIAYYLFFGAIVAIVTKREQIFLVKELVRRG